LLDSLHTTKTVASSSTATEILCKRAEPEFRCRRGPCVRTLDRPIEGQAQHLDSERKRGHLSNAHADSSVRWRRPKSCRSNPVLEFARYPSAWARPRQPQART
jgi:hypothetical protein